MKIITRGGYNWTERYPQIVRGALALKSKSFTIDGEGVVCGADGIADFALLHSRQHDKACFLYGFDLLEEGGTDLRAKPLFLRKDRLEQMLAKSKSGIVYSEHADLDGSALFESACKMGLEGIVSKRKGRPYMSGPSSCKHWIKVKNPKAPAMQRIET